MSNMNFWVNTYKDENCTAFKTDKSAQFTDKLFLSEEKLNKFLSGFTKVAKKLATVCIVQEGVEVIKIKTLWCKPKPPKKKKLNLKAAVKKKRAVKDKIVIVSQKNVKIVEESFLPEEPSFIPSISGKSITVKEVKRNIEILEEEPTVPVLCINKGKVCEVKKSFLPKAKPMTTFRVGEKVCFRDYEENKLVFGKVSRCEGNGEYSIYYENTKFGEHCEIIKGFAHIEKVCSHCGEVDPVDPEELGFCKQCHQVVSSEKPKAKAKAKAKPKKLFQTASSRDVIKFNLIDMVTVKRDWVKQALLTLDLPKKIKVAESKTIAVNSVGKLMTVVVEFADRKSASTMLLTITIAINTGVVLGAELQGIYGVI